MHNQNRLPLITSRTGRVQHITGVQVQVLHHVHIVLLHLVQVATRVARLHVAVVAVVTAVVEVAEAAAVHTQVVPLAEVLQEVAVVDVRVEAVHLHLVAVNFRKHIKI